eukprot:6204370-Pleurochrysis_carterae.AAC.1
MLGGEWRAVLVGGDGERRYGLVERPGEMGRGNRASWQDMTGVRLCLFVEGDEDLRDGDR